MVAKSQILIVDDNPNFRKTMELILNYNGYKIASAKGGFEAIESVKETPFDAILMDIKMPELNGVDTYRRIKEIRPEAVVVMMTAYALEGLIQEAKQEGAYGVLFKPLNIDEVIDMIEAARRNHSAPSFSRNVH
jgi:two-component system response regulator HydG